MRRLSIAILLCVSAAAAATFTLEQVLSAPFPSELTASRAGGKVAWLLNERGARNIWIASAPDYKGARLTDYKDDDGQDVGQLSWTPDGRAVVYVRGGDLEFLGRPDPNPGAIAAGVEQAVWIAAPGEAPRKLGEGHSPAVSPTGDVVAYLKAGQIWWASLAASGKAAQLIMARAGVTAAELQWSPDGSRLAFVSDRGDHSFIAVYDVASKSLTYLDPSVDRDRDPAWSPDGKQIAFLRQFGREGGRGARRTGTPWTIRVATVADGAGRQIWKADEGPGSVFHPVVARQQLVWASGDRIVFPWERDGWAHLYSVAVEGGAATLLTPGEFEVEHVSYSPDGREVVFSSNQDDIDHRHIWRVSAAGGPPRAVTSGDSLEWTPVFAAGAVAFIHSDARRPARAAIQVNGAVRDLAPDSIPADFPADSLVAPQQVIFNATDGMPIHGQLFLPPGGRAGQRHPALVFMHGGSRRQMLLGWHYMDYYNNAYAMNQYLASQGYVVLSINYRSGIGYGLDFREALNYGATGASEYQDVVGAGQYLKGRPDVDSAHIGLWGGSYGGYLTALGLARNSDLFAAGVDFHGVHDWSVRNAGPNAATTPAPGGRGATASAAGSSDTTRSDATRVAFESSPMAAVKTWKSPVLLIHGDDDRNVAFSETVNLANALRGQNVYFEQLIIPDEIHGFLRHASWLRAYHAAADFFKRKL
ncbi:MAG TPA: prolyl oligopeptidase family serine peptidase [Bryobacteraceae bacterium]|nr:prolyl oligopeptidase family serine peptidase [Bryobacteraceae bacterium]